MYFIIEPQPDEEGNIMGIIYEKDIDGRSWVSGNPFLVSPNIPKFRHPPKEPIKLHIKKGREDAPWPSFLHQPLPIMSTKLLKTIRSTGVDNIDAYEAHIYYHDESLASKDYWAINLVGKLAAANLSRSTYDADQQDSIVSMSFDKLVVDERQTNSIQMFRLAENITTILVNERVKLAVEKSNIQLIEFYRPSEVILL